MLDSQLYGLDPAGHHLTSVLLHIATAILLFLVLRQMTGALWRSAFVAAIFAIHPLRVESVAWVAERKDVLSGLFCMLTLWAYVRYARRPWSPARYGLVLLLFALGLLCKPMLVTLPGVGRKTANVVRSVAMDLPGLPVDTHVTRLSRRLGLTVEQDPVKIEYDLNAVIPAAERGAFSLRLILHGRRICTARRPACEACVLADFCPSAELPVAPKRPRKVAAR